MLTRQWMFGGTLEQKAKSGLGFTQQNRGRPIPLGNAKDFRDDA
jgi:hypothetical protein